MNKSNLKCKAIQTLMNGDLGKEVNSFLRGEVEIATLQIIVSGDKKIAYIDYEDRSEVAKRVEESGIEFEDYMKKDFYHAVEVSVPMSKDLAEKINEVKAENPDMETITTNYYNGVNTKNALIIYASRSEFEKHEEEQKASNEAKAKARAEELAKMAVKEPEDMDNINNVLDKYAKEENPTVTAGLLQVEQKNSDQAAAAEVSEKSKKTTGKKTK